MIGLDVDGPSIASWVSPVPTLYSLMPDIPPDDAISLLSGEMIMEPIPSTSYTNVYRNIPDATSHNLMDLSPDEADATILESGENITLRASAEWPLKVLCIICVVVFQISNVLSEGPNVASLASNDNAMV
jgi:hypothetical protein